LKSVVYSIIPIKKLTLAKSRLSAFLKPKERMKLTQCMLEDVVATCLASESLTKTLVVSPDRFLGRAAEEQGALFIESHTGDLNNDITTGIDWSIESGAKSVLILPSDLPAITVDNIHAIFRMVSKVPSVVLTPSRNGGTNMLFLQPPNIIRPQFGLNSFNRHLKEAEKIGVKLSTYESPRVTLDIDTEFDIGEFLKLDVLNAKSQNRTKRYLETVLSSREYST
jgi:2-phospho-L-lactate guanylyltransferase